MSSGLNSDFIGHGVNGEVSNNFFTNSSLGSEVITSPGLLFSLSIEGYGSNGQVSFNKQIGLLSP